MLSQLRIQLIKNLVEINEKIVFNKRLKIFYKTILKEPLTHVIDVGVNEGQSIEIFRKLNKDCIIDGFEPNPKLFKKLHARYGEDRKIRLYKMGISNEVGTKVFYENVLHSTSSFEKLDFDSQYLAKKAKILGVKKKDIITESYEVEITTLGNYINRYCTEDIDILKIDTEGHEFYCLEGLFSEKLKVAVKFIQLEEHNDDMYLEKKSFKEIEGLLSKHNYEVAGRIKHGFGDFEEVIFKYLGS